MDHDDALGDPPCAPRKVSHIGIAAAATRQGGRRW